MEGYLTLRTQTLPRLRQSGQSLAHGLLHPLRLGGAAVVELNLGRGEQGLIPLPQALGGDGLHVGHVAQLVDPEGLLPTHLLHQTVGGIAALIIHLTPNPGNEVLLFSPDIIRAETAVLGIGPQQQLSQQGSRPLQNRLSLQGIGVVQEAGHKTHALGLALFPHHRFDGAAVQLVQSRGQGLQVGVVRRTLAQHRRDQGILRGRLRLQRGQ